MTAATGHGRHAPALASKLHARGGVVRLYATTPPPSGASGTSTADEADRLIERVQRLPLDGIVVYDLQDESGRNPAPRPFPYLPRGDTRRYSGLLARIGGYDSICFKSIGSLSEAEWVSWLAETAIEHDIRLLALAGRPVSSNAPSAISLSRAYQLAAEHPAQFALGGVTIAERHRDRGGETRRIFEKQASGCGFFISQTVYDASLAIRLLKSYARKCRDRRVEPRRMILSFAPCGGSKTVEFMKWLGIAVPPDIETSIVAAPAPLTRSIEICLSSLRQILAAIPRDVLPIGFCVESLSTSREQTEASTDLFHALTEAADDGLRHADRPDHAILDFA